jgi:serine/threonine-protein kinase
MIEKLMAMCCGVLIAVAALASAGVAARDSRDAQAQPAASVEQASLSALIEQADRAEIAGDYATARDLLDRADRQSQASADGDVARADVLVRRGVFENNMGEFELAERLLQDGLGLLREQDKPDARQMAAALNGIGYGWQHRGNFEAAEKNFEAALPWYDRAYGAQSPEFARVLSNLGELYRQHDRLEQAVKYGERASAIAQKLPDSEYDVRSQVENNLGTLAFSQGDSEQAVRHFERALNIAEGALGGEHPTLAPMLSNIGVMLYGQGRHEQARARLERALALEEKAYGADSPQLIASLGNLVDVYTALDLPEEAAAARARMEKMIGAQD